MQRTAVYSKWRPVNEDTGNTFIFCNQENGLTSKLCNIRTAKKCDTKHIYTIHTDAIRELCSECYNRDEISRWIARQYPEKYEPFIEKEVMFVATLDNQIVGFGHVEKFDDDTSEVCGLFVSPACARKGIGSLLLQFLEEKAKADGYQNMRLKSSQNAKGFYEASGYKTIQKVDCHCAGDQALCCILMTKSLRSK